MKRTRNEQDAENKRKRYRAAIAKRCAGILALAKIEDNVSILEDAFGNLDRDVASFFDTGTNRSKETYTRLAYLPGKDCLPEDEPVYEKCRTCGTKVRK